MSWEAGPHCFVQGRQKRFSQDSPSHPAASEPRIWIFTCPFDYIATPRSTALHTALHTALAGPFCMSLSFNSFTHAPEI